MAALIHRFAYLKYALALVLVFIGAKIFLAGIIGKIPSAISLGVTFGLLLGGVIVSLYKTRGEQPSTLTDVTPPEKRTAADNAGTSRSPRP